jgi:hypothetical protein
MEKKPEEQPPLTVKELAAMGGKARAKGLTKKRRKEIASDAARARWGEKDGAEKKEA